MKTSFLESPKEEYRRLIVIACLCVGFIVLTAGCGQQISHEKQVEVDGSEVTTTEKTVTKNPDGGVNVTKKETTVDPSDGTSDSTTETKTVNK